MCMYVCKLSIHVCGITFVFPFHRCPSPHRVCENGTTKQTICEWTSGYCSVVQLYLQQDLVLGAYYPDGNAYLTGAMDSIKVFGNALFDGDILALYTAG